MRKDKIESLNLLRAFLALVVVNSHIPTLSEGVGLPFFSNWPIFHRGTESVFVFFALSGYLIIGLLYDEKKSTGAISIKNFYARRILRLYPAYYLVLFFGLLYYRYLLPAVGMPYSENYTLMEGILWNVGFLPNVFIGKFDPGSVLLILWSIGIEEQFYLVIAPLLYFAKINHYLKSILIFTVIYFGVFHSGLFPFLDDYWFYYFFISAGGVLALFSRKGYPLHFDSPVLRVVLYVVFILYFTSDWFLFKNEMLKNLTELILFSLVISNIVKDNEVLGRFSFMNYLGKISYGVYLYHMIVLNFVLFVFLKLRDNLTIPAAIVIIFVNLAVFIGTIIVSHISYQYFEMPFLKLKDRFRN
nr:acyltransferase [uncultured Carboxylicivirga sp.]